MESFGAAYPERAATIAHRLCRHELFELEALIALAKRMRP
jgi:hypothetical protein